MAVLRGGRTMNGGVLMKQIQHLPAVVLYTGTALLNPPPHRNSAAPDASPLARLDAKQTRRAKPPGVFPCGSFQRAHRVASSSFEHNPRSAT